MKLGGFGQIADYEKIQTAGFPVLTGSRALPIADPWFFTDHFSMKEYEEYQENACRSAGMIGMKCIIIGNGKVRMLLDETSAGKESFFIDFMRMFVGIAAKHHLKIS